MEGTGSTAKVFTIHTDHLTGSSVVTNTAGNQEELVDYFPYGSIRLDEKAGTFDEQRKYAGSEHDSDTNLNYMNARYYNSGIGKFISQDPYFWTLIDSYLIDPQQQNSYSYARNNPLVYNDPDGKSIFSDIGKGFKRAYNSIVGFFTGNNSRQTPPSPTANISNNVTKPTPQVSTPTQNNHTWDPVTDKRIGQLDPRVQQPTTNFLRRSSLLAAENMLYFGYECSGL